MNYVVKESVNVSLKLNLIRMRFRGLKKRGAFFCLLGQRRQQRSDHFLSRDEADGELVGKRHHLVLLVIIGFVQFFIAAAGRRNRLFLSREEQKDSKGAFVLKQNKTKVKFLFLYLFF